MLQEGASQRVISADAGVVLNGISPQVITAGESVPPHRAAPQLRRVGAAYASGVLAAGLPPECRGDVRTGPVLDGPGVGAGRPPE